MIGFSNILFLTFDPPGFTGSFPMRLSSSYRLHPAAESMVATASSATLQAQKRMAHTSF
jgi:hypothetical protein